MEKQVDTIVSKLNFGDPLYLHPSDASCTSLVNFKLKGIENYKSWSCAMESALQTKNKVCFIDGSLEKSLTNDVLGKQWDRCNAVVLSWILSSISEELYNVHIYSKIASEVWCELIETYDNVDCFVMFNLHKKINCLTQSGTSVSDYYHKLNSLWKQYDTMLKLPQCVCDASKEIQSHSNLLKLMQFLMGLDEVYQPIRSNILTRDPLPSVKTAFSLVLGDESHRNSSQTDSKSSAHSSVFFSKTYQQKNLANPYLKCKKCLRNGHAIDGCFEIIGYPTKNVSNMKCSKCGRTNHTVDKCFEIVGYPQSFKKKSNKTIAQQKLGLSNNSCETPTTVSLTKNQLSRLMSLLEENTSQTEPISNMSGLDNKRDLGGWWSM